MSSGWHIIHRMSSGRLSRNWYLIRMSYDNAVMSSGWHRLPFVSHPDEIANFDFPHHAVALQRFRNFHWLASDCEIIIWDAISFPTAIIKAMENTLRNFSTPWIKYVNNNINRLMRKQWYVRYCVDLVTLLPLLVVLMTAAPCLIKDPHTDGCEQETCITFKILTQMLVYHCMLQH